MSHNIHNNNHLKYRNLEGGELNYFFDGSIVPVKAKVYQILDYQQNLANHNPYEQMSAEEKYKSYLALERSMGSNGLPGDYYRDHLRMLGLDNERQNLYIEFKLLAGKTSKICREPMKMLFINPYLGKSVYEIACLSDELRNLKAKNLIGFTLYELLDKYIKEASDQLLAM